MTVENIEQADDLLADLYWWLKGFFEAVQGNGEAKKLSQKTSDIRSFLARINEGEIRRLGDETAIVLTFAEWEKICDCLLIKPDSIIERDIAVTTARNVHQKYREQSESWRSRQRLNSPF